MFGWKILGVVLDFDLTFKLMAKLAYQVILNKSEMKRTILLLRKNIPMRISIHGVIIG